MELRDFYCISDFDLVMCVAHHSGTIHPTTNCKTPGCVGCRPSPDSGGGDLLNLRAVPTRLLPQQVEVSMGAELSHSCDLGQSEDENAVNHVSGEGRVFQIGYAYTKTGEPVLDVIFVKHLKT